MIKNIIFDFDGVLVDSEILVARAFSKYLRNIGHNFNQKDFFQFAGKKTIQVISHLSEKFLITLVNFLMLISSRGESISSSIQKGLGFLR